MTPPPHPLRVLRGGGTRPAGVAGLGGYVGVDDDGLAASVAHAATNPKNMNILTGIGSTTVDMAPEASLSAKQARTAVEQRMAPSIQQNPLPQRPQPEPQLRRRWNHYGSR